MNDTEKIHPDGVHTEYYSDGRKKSKKTWKDGELNGPAVFWNNKGERYSEGSFRHGKHHGEWHSWDFLKDRESIATIEDGIHVEFIKTNKYNRIVEKWGDDIDTVSLRDKFYKQDTLNHGKIKETLSRYVSTDSRPDDIKEKISLLEKHKLELIGGETNGVKINRHAVNYLYVSDEGYEHDKLIQLYYVELCKLNDYFYMTLESADKYSNLSKGMDFNFTDDVGGNDRVMAIINRFSHSHGYSNDEVGVLYAPASCLALLYFFTISHLKDLNIEFNLDEYYEYVNNRNYKQKLKKEYDKKYGKSPSEFEELLYLLDHLKLKIGAKNIEKTRDAIELITVINKIRNKYAHGEFQELKVLMQEINIQDTLATISSFFETMHNAIFNGHRDENSPLFDERWIE